MTIRDKFKTQYFIDIHTRLIENLSGQIQIKLSEQDKPDIDEYFVQEKSEDIIERRVTKVDTSLKVVRNKSHTPFKDKILSQTGLSINPQFDIRVLGADYKMLYAVYEIKSRLQGNSLQKNDIYKDIQRLALVKCLFPETICIFLLPGLLPDMKNEFESQNILIPHTFNIAGNPNYNKKGSYFSVKLKSDIVTNELSDALIKLKTKEIKIRLSQVLKGKRHILFSYEVLI